MTSGAGVMKKEEIKLVMSENQLAVWQHQYASIWRNEITKRKGERREESDRRLGVASRIIIGGKQNRWQRGASKKIASNEK